MTAFTRTWNTAYEQSPADTDDASEGAQRIRDGRIDARERLGVDHSMAGDTDDGAHKKVTLLEQASDPTTATDTGFTYTKDVGGVTELFYKDSAGNILQLTQGGTLNPAAITSISEVDTLDNMAFSGAVASSALTVSVKTLAGTDPASTDLIKVGMRNVTLTSSIYNIRQISSALSIVAPAGATLGVAAATKGWIAVYLIDNAGTLELAVMGLADPRDRRAALDETVLIDTTVIDTSSDSLGILYSTTARSSLPVRFVGLIEITSGATAGNWDNAPVVLDPSNSKDRFLAGFAEYLSSGTFIVPEGVNEVNVELLSGGGGGGGGGPGYASGASDASGGGGAGGGCGLKLHNKVTVTPGDSVTVTVGAAGAAGTAGSSGSAGGTGGTGGSTTFDTITIIGGNGGPGGGYTGGGSGAGGVAPVIPIGGTAGSQSVGTFADAGDTVAAVGGKGGTGSTIWSGAGGGGGTGYYGNGGLGADSVTGTDQVGSTGGAADGNGAGGGGGSGGRRTSSTGWTNGGAGGVGSVGRVRISW